MNYTLNDKKGKNFFEDDLLNQVLWFNDILTDDDYKKLTDSDFPYYFKGYKEFIQKINYHKKGKIIVIGDYDADGTCATSILLKFLNYLNISCDYIIGERMVDGYGMTNDLIDKAIQKKATLIITVDNGIKCKNQVAYAFEKGIDVIVTDHHQVDLDCLPNCLTFNPHLNQNLVFEDICGAVTIFVLIFCYLKYYNISDKDFVYELYELAALATIGDMMPLYYFNRKIVEALVKTINKKQIKNAGLKRITELLDLNDINANDIAYKIIPILNAPGRMDTADIVVEILTNKDNLDENITTALSLNEKRKEETKKALSGVLLEETPINVLLLPNLNEGIIGIIAGSIANDTKKPTFIFTNTENGQCKGSARSISDFDILNLVKTNMSDDIIAYGGHKAALGITLKSKEAFLSFKEKIKNTKVDTIPTINCIDYRFSSLKSSFEKFKALEPFGEGLMSPIFYISGIPQNFRILKKIHCTFEMKINGINEPFILFNKIITTNFARLAFTIKKEAYNGRITYKGFVVELL